MKHQTRQNINRWIAAVILPLLLSCIVSAQELEYKMELGALAGGSAYMGDANFSAPMKDVSMAGGVLARYNLNPRMVVKGNLALGKIKGNTQEINNKFPENGHASFNRLIFDLGTQFEYNFFAYGAGTGYKDSRKLTPYILAGFGLTYAPQPADHVFALNLPLGMGVKYKLADRINVGAEWSMRFTTSDRLDVDKTEGLILEDPYQIKGKGMKNKDGYSLLIAYISYDLFPKYRKCNN